MSRGVLGDITIPVDWELGQRIVPDSWSGSDASDTAAATARQLARSGSARQLRKRTAARANQLAASAAKRPEIARSAKLGALDESPRPSDVSGYARSSEASFVVSQYDIYGENVQLRVRRKVADLPSQRRHRIATVAADAPFASSKSFELPWTKRPVRSKRPQSAEQLRHAELMQMTLEDRELWAVERRSGRLTAAIGDGQGSKAAQLRKQMRHWDDVFRRRLEWAWECWGRLMARAKRRNAALLQRPCAQLKEGLAAFKFCFWRAQLQQQTLLGFMRRIAQPHLAKVLHTWQPWARDRKAARAVQEKMVRRVLQSRTAPAFDTWVDLLEVKRRRLQRARGTILRLRERDVSRCWERWLQFVDQMRALQSSEHSSRDFSFAHCHPDQHCMMPAFSLTPRHYGSVAVLETWVVRSRNIIATVAWQRWQDAVEEIRNGKLQALKATGGSFESVALASGLARKQVRCFHRDFGEMG